MNDTPLVAELRRQNRWLKAIAIGSLATLAIAAAVPTPITDEITVRRINVVNADGTLSSVIAGRGRLPRVIHNGQPIGDERSEGGFIFYNAVGDETGGFVFDGAIADDGKPRGGLHFSMDRFGGDQQLVIAHGEGGGIMRTGLSIMDRGKPEEYEPIYEAMVKETDPERKAALQAAWVAAGGPQTERLFVGRTPGNSSALVLADTAGTPRLMFLVTPEGKAEIRFLDREGTVVRTLSGEPALE